MKKSILAFSLLAILFTACEKDKDEEEQPVAVTTASISGTYTLGAVTAKANGSGEVSQDDYYESCQKDNKITLNANGSAEFIDAGVKCDPPEDETGSWSLTNNNTKINIDGEEFTIQSFDGKVLKAGETFTLNGVNFTYTFTFNKQ